MAGNDSLNGFGGNDYLDGGAGADILAGGAGDDVYVVGDLSDEVREFAGEGEDRVYALGSYALAGGVFVETLIAGGSVIASGRALSGNELANNIWDDAGNGNLFGAAGNDSLYGFAGHDLIDGGDGADLMVGDTQDDIYIVDNAADTVLEYANEGNDRIWAVVDYALTPGAHVEILAAGGPDPLSPLRLTGNDLLNNLWGNAGGNLLSALGGNDALFGFDGGDDLFGGSEDDYLDGGNGNDNLFGGTGRDTLIGGAGADSFLFNTLPGVGEVDVVADFAAADDTIALDHRVFSGLSAGALAAGSFVLGSSAGDADDRLIYDQGSGALFYDADGTGEAAMVQLAILNSAPTLTAADFFVV